MNKSIFLVVLLISGISAVDAQEIIIDGNAEDWTGIDPIAIDPINDTWPSGVVAEPYAAFYV